jgi:hypothetical protein
MARTVSSIEKEVRKVRELIDPHISGCSNQALPVLAADILAYALSVLPPGEQRAEALPTILNLAIETLNNHNNLQKGGG